MADGSDRFEEGESLALRLQRVLQSRVSERECIDYKTSMITDEDPLRGLLFY